MIANNEARAGRALCGAITAILITAAGPLPAMADSDDTNGSMATYRDGKYTFWFGLGVSYTEWDKINEITAQDMDFFLRERPEGTFRSEVDDSGVAPVARLGGYYDPQDGPDEQRNPFVPRLGWWAQVSSLPDFDNMEWFGFGPLGPAGHQRVIRSETELEGNLSYGLAADARWRISDNWYAGVRVSYDVYDFDVTTRTEFLGRQNGQLQRLDSETLTDDLEDSAVSPGVYVGYAFGDDDGGPGWYVRAGYSATEVEGADFDQWHFTISRGFNLNGRYQGP